MVSGEMLLRGLGGGEGLDALTLARPPRVEPLLALHVGLGVDALGGQELHGGVGVGRDDGAQEEGGQLRGQHQKDQVGQLPRGHDLDDRALGHLGSRGFGFWEPFRCF